MLEEVAKYMKDATVDARPFLTNVVHESTIILVQRVGSVKLNEFLDAAHDGTQNEGNLRVLVNENQCVGNIAVAKVNDT